MKKSNEFVSSLSSAETTVRISGLDRYYLDVPHYKSAHNSTFSDLISRTLSDRPENENRLRGINTVYTVPEDSENTTAIPNDNPITHIISGGIICC